MLITFASKGLAAREAANCLHRLESRLVGSEGRRAILTQSSQLPDPWADDPDGRVDIAALGLEALSDASVRDAASIILVVAEGVRTSIAQLGELVRTTAAATDTPVLLLGTGVHHGPSGCAIIPIRPPMLSPDRTYACTLYSAVLKEVLAAPSRNATRDASIRRTVADRMAALSAFRHGNRSRSIGGRRALSPSVDGSARSFDDVLSSFLGGFR